MLPKKLSFSRMAQRLQFFTPGQEIDLFYSVNFSNLLCFPQALPFFLSWYLRTLIVLFGFTFKGTLHLCETSTSSTLLVVWGWFVYWFHMEVSWLYGGWRPLFLQQMFPFIHKTVIPGNGAILFHLLTDRQIQFLVWYKSQNKLFNWLGF